MKDQFTRPQGELHGDSKALKNSTASTNPGYNTKKSQQEASDSDVKRGYCKEGGFNADSDPADPA